MVGLAGPVSLPFLYCCSSVAPMWIMAIEDCSSQWQQPGGGREVAVARGWGEVAVALEYGSFKGGNGRNEGGS